MRKELVIVIMAKKRDSEQKIVIVMMAKTTDSHERIIILISAPGLQDHDFRQRKRESVTRSSDEN